jgi:hypothetical protein
MSKILSNTGFQPLKEVWLGDCYPAKFYDHLPSTIKEAFYQITEWTKEDLYHIEKTLKDFGVIVRRPKFDDSIDTYIQNDILLKPPITPRDDNLVLGDTLYHLRNRYKKNPWQPTLDFYQQCGNSIIEEQDGPLACLNPPSIVRVGKDIYIDFDTHSHIWHFVVPILTEWAKDYRVHVCNTNGHSDGVFCPVKQGLIVATHYLSIYDRTFPNWEVYNLPYPKHNPWFGKWHLDDSKLMSNNRFADHIENYALDWIGNFSETVFEVNMLVIDEHNVLAIKEDDKLFKWLESQGIDVTLCNFRCRGFWDGGLHCLTLDIHRDGELIDYFPGRPQFNYLDWL